MKGIKRSPEEKLAIIPEEKLAIIKEAEGEGIVAVLENAEYTHQQ